MSGLTKEIINHIILNFINGPCSLKSAQFKLSELLIFEVDGFAYQRYMWGVDVSVGQVDLQVILADISDDSEGSNFTLFISSAGTSYAMTSDTGSFFYSVDDNQWLIATIYMQATLLSSMELIKDSFCKITKLDSNESVNLLKSFIEYESAL